MSFNQKSILAIITARGGSKSIPKKNIYLVDGKPLIGYTIMESQNSKYLDKIIVSSDDSEILSISASFGADILRRSQTASSDFASSEMVISEVLEELKAEGLIFDVLILLQPTSPLRSADQIDQAIEFFFSRDADTLISVCEAEHHPYKFFKSNEYGYLEGIIDNKAPFMRRQDLPNTYRPNGAIYITYCDLFTQSGSLFSSKTIPFLMDKDSSIDIDSLDDINKLLEILKK